MNKYSFALNGHPDLSLDVVVAQRVALSLWLGIWPLLDVCLCLFYVSHGFPGLFLQPKGMQLPVCATLCPTLPENVQGGILQGEFAR